MILKEYYKSKVGIFDEMQHSFYFHLCRVHIACSVPQWFTPASFDKTITSCCKKLFLKIWLLFNAYSVHKQKLTYHEGSYPRLTFFYFRRVFTQKKKSPSIIIYMSWRFLLYLVNREKLICSRFYNCAQRNTSEMRLTLSISAFKLVNCLLTVTCGGYKTRGSEK